MIRPRTLGVVAWRDLRRVLAGRRLGFIGLALAMLLPIGAIPLQAPQRGPPEVPVVQGEIPAELEGKLLHSGSASVRLVGSDPITARAATLPSGVRRVLNTLDEEPSVTRVLWRPGLVLPGRNLLVALLAISLLTGPLAESLPGEREQGTLETLLAAAISRGEVVGGKWLAWTAAASTMALLGGGAGLLTGAQQVGLWVLGVPLSVSVAVALGMWLVRSAGDAMSGATAPMRVIPVVAVALLGVSWWLSSSSAVLAAAIPLGGGLLMAGGMVSEPAAVLAAIGGAALATIVLLAATAHALTRTEGGAERGGGLLLIGAALWWLPVSGPELWGWAGRGEVVDASAGLLAGGALLLLAALVVTAREPHPAPRRRATWPGLALGSAAGVLLAGLQQLPGGMAMPAGAAAVVVVIGQELWFRSILLSRLGVWWSTAVWIGVVGLTAPVHAAVSGLVLGVLSRRHGVLVAILAALIWRVAG